MLEIRNLTKVYRSKTGESVRALDDVSVSFPESGMVFILGKSGSGKSTLLNIMGGLDSYDSGEFIIKGKSSKNFAGSDFDAYRNTFIGFIFQEYNVLDDFTVGANIALALELQGKKATPDKINGILSQVDLVNYAKRKPNELSGGQKQRVAIARALVKDPQIIMADEPTGALDSNTGKQIFDSLKRLSQEKLVLIVSHDRDFAEKYADRIIELADGKIISDVTKHEHESQKLSEGIDKISGQILRIKGGYKLTEADLKMINEYLSQNSDDVILSSDGRVNDELRSAAGISEKGTMSVFEGTDAEKDIKLKKYEKKDSKFIRSRLPLKNALRMGASGLKYKKFRLVMTIILSLIAFVLFGFSDTMASYQKIVATTDSIIDSNVKNASVTLGVRHTTKYGDNDPYTYFNSAQLNDDDIEWLRAQTGLNFVPVYTGDLYSGGFSVTSLMSNYEHNTVYSGKIHGLVSLHEKDISATGFSIVGRMPEAKGEIAITELLYRQFNQYGFNNSDLKETVAAGNLTTDENSPNSIIGKHITFGGMNGKGYAFEIVGVVDTGFDYDRYQSFLPQDNNVIGNQEGNAIADMVLQMEIQSELNYGFHGLGFAHMDDIQEIAEKSAMMYQQLSTYMNGWNSSMYIAIKSSDGDSDDKNGMELTYNQVADSSVLSKLNKVTWFDGKPRTQLAANEIVLPSNFMDNMIPWEASLSIDAKAIADQASRLYGKANWDATNPEQSYFNRLMEAAARRYISDCVQNPDIVEYVCEFALYDRGETINGADQAKEFWMRYWFEDGYDQPPVNAYDGSVKYKYEFESTVREDMLPFLVDMYGLDIPDGVSADRLYSLYDCLYNTGEEYPEFTVQRNQISEMIRSVYVYIDVVESKLWENEDFVALMIANENYDMTEQNWNDYEEWERQNRVTDFYNYWYLNDVNYGYETNEFGTYSGRELNEMAETAFLNMIGGSIEDLLNSLVIESYERSYETESINLIKTYDFKIVGTYDVESANHTQMIISDTVMTDYNTWYEENMKGSMGDYFYEEDIAEHDNGIWTYALAPLGSDRSVVQKLVEMSYDENVDLKFELQNPIMDTLGAFNEFIEIGSKIFFWVGVGFAVFSALLLMNFIATSISYKKREIGVLRAVGARSSDVFKIFFSEALIIAMINFILSTAVVVGGIIFVNTWMRNNGINITLLSYGVRQFALMLALSVGVALLSSFLPVYNIARRKPVDAIKDR